MYYQWIKGKKNNNVMWLISTYSWQSGKIYNILQKYWLVLLDNNDMRDYSICHLVASKVLLVHCHFEQDSEGKQLSTWLRQKPNGSFHGYHCKLCPLGFHMKKFTNQKNYKSIQIRSFFYNCSSSGLIPYILPIVLAHYTMLRNLLDN